MCVWGGTVAHLCDEREKVKCPLDDSVGELWNEAWAAALDVGDLCVASRRCRCLADAGCRHREKRIVWCSGRGCV